MHEMGDKPQHRELRALPCNTEDAGDGAYGL